MSNRLILFIAALLIPTALCAGDETQTVLHLSVSSLGDSGPGTLRAALNQCTINGGNCEITGRPGDVLLRRQLGLKDAHNVTIIGNGMTLRRYGINVAGCENVRVSDLRILVERIGLGTGTNHDCLLFYDTHNIRVDHCTFFGGTDECFDVYQDCDNAIITYCLIGNAGLEWRTDTDGINSAQSKSVLVGGQRFAGTCTFQFCAIGGSAHRNPKFSGPRGTFHVVNCVLGCADLVHPCKLWLPYIIEFDHVPKDAPGHAGINIINNYFAAWTELQCRKRPVALDNSRLKEVPSIFVSGNRGHMCDPDDPWAVTMDGLRQPNVAPRTFQRSEPWPLPDEVKVVPTLVAVSEVYAHAGCRERTEVEIRFLEKLFGGKQ